MSKCGTCGNEMTTCVCPKGLGAGEEDADTESDAVFDEKVEQVSSAILQQYLHLQKEAPSKVSSYIDSLREVLNSEIANNLLENLEEGAFTHEECEAFTSQFKNLRPNRAMLEVLSDNFHLNVSLPQQVNTSASETIGHIVLLCGTSTAGKTSICTQAELEARKIGKSWHIDGADLASERIWTDESKLNGVNYPSAENHFTASMKEHFPSSQSQPVDRAREAFGARTLAVAVLSRGYLGNPAVDKVDLTPQKDIKSQAARVHESLCEENQAKYSVDNIEDLLEIIKQCPEPSEFQRLHPYPPLEQLNEVMLDQAIDRAKKGESTILDIVGNEMINDQLMTDSIKGKLIESGLSSSSGEVVVAHCPIDTLIERIDIRNKQALENQRPEDVRQAFFPFSQYGMLYKKTTEPTLQIGEVSRQDILEASIKYKGKPEEVTLLLENLGFEDNIDKVSVTYRTEGAAVVQTGEQSPLEIAQHLCSKVFSSNEPVLDAEERAGELKSFNM